MRLVLKSGNVIIATKALTTKADYDRVSDASMLTFQGSYYSFSGIQQGSCVFEETGVPVSVDGFVNKV